MKKHKIHLKRLVLQKRTIAAVNANSVQGGTGITCLPTQLVIVCATTTDTNTITSYTVPISEKETVCITDQDCPSKEGGPCPGPIIKTTFC